MGQGSGRSLTALLEGVRAVVRADSDPVRQALFEGLRAVSPSARWAVRIHRWLGRSWLSSLMVAGYGARSFVSFGAPRERDVSLLSLAVHANARRHVERIQALSPAAAGSVRTGKRALLSLAAAGRLFRMFWFDRRLRRSLRVIHHVNRRHDFLVSCRVASVLACYSRSIAILRSAKPSAVLVSSDSNPEEIALVAAARRLGVHSVFVSHAYTTSVSPPLDFTLSILEGEAAVAAHARKATPKGAIVLAGVEGESRPMAAQGFSTKNPVIGLFAPKVVVWPTLVSIIVDCRQVFGARQFLIRWHPSMLERPNLARLMTDTADIIETDSAAPIRDVATRCDWVIADAGSNVHLPTLKLGVPTVCVRDFGPLDRETADLYGFVADRVILPPVPSIRDLSAPLAVDFYSGTWSERFRRYDASYLQPAEVMHARIRSALADVLARAAHPDTTA